MAKRLTPEERQRRADEKARRKREREAAREAGRRAKEEEKERRKREKEDRRRQKEIERGQKMKRRPRWLYWLIREQAAKRREHEQYMNAGRTALALGRAIRQLQQKIMAFIGPIMEHVAGIKSPAARLAWTHEPWTPQDRTRYNWGKKLELAGLWAQYPEGVAEQDPAWAAADARRKTLARHINNGKALDRALDRAAAELRENELNAVTSSLERSYRQAYADIAGELEAGRRAIDADREGASRIADAKDYTKKGSPRRAAPETQIPRNMPAFGNYGESVKFGEPAPDQIKAALNAEFEGKDYSARIWGDTDRLAREMKDVVRAAIINGEGPRGVAQKLAQRMGVAFSHAYRLVRTETSRILNQAEADRMQERGEKRYRFVAVHDERTCGKCNKRDGKTYALKDRKAGLNFPPLHPHCRCFILPDDTPDGDGGDWLDRLLDRWESGKLTPRKGLEEAVAKKGAAIKRQEATDAAEAEDTGMKEEEQRQREEIGGQRRAIQRAEAKMVIRPPKNQKSHHAEEAEKRKGKSVKVKTDIGEINLNPEQIKAKKKEHAEEFGIDKKKKDAEEKYRRRVISIIKTAETTERGHYSEQHKEAIMFKNARGETVLVDAITKEFITCFVINNNHEHRWLDTMQPLTDEEKKRMREKA